MDDANPALEAGTEPVFDVRKLFGGLHLTPGSYIEMFTGLIRGVPSRNGFFSSYWILPSNLTVS